ncbi:alpha/beta hydrolase [Chelativorans sp. M5D2P16]|uniref:alpha/beta hydrolase n=1 Tax=Chelativorans sp. M5D2P16 TaxID=3095678 RepID=UPI002ACA397D|nr:alpha/beta hydrolase [Chelativorans sp. M5D2P16]MDZ5698142.1 alpha/beta hydrolase [Chelativorans sp. M5D2P16]
MGFDTATTLETPTGATLRLYTRRPQRPPRAVVQINHGLAEHAGRYARFADFLTERGFAAYAHDHRGHGHTTAPGAPLGSFGPEPAAGKVVADVLAVHDRIGEEHPGLPVIVFGHSLGGMIALAFLARHGARADAAAVWNAPTGGRLPAHAARTLLAWERFRLGSDVPSRLMPRFTFQAWARAVPDARTPFDWLSHDGAEVDAYIADPLCGWPPTIAMWRTIFAIDLAIADGLAAIPKDLPIHLAGGAEDPVTARGRAVKQLATRLKRTGVSNLETRIYAETRHESLNELGRTRIMQDFSRWAAGIYARG